MSRFVKPRDLNRIALSVACVVLFTGCRPYQVTEENSSSVMDIGKTGNGKAIDNATALEIVLKVGSALAFPSYMVQIGKAVHYQAGYLEHYQSSGASYAIAPSSSDKNVFTRTGEQRMYSTSGMGQMAGSKYMDHAALLRSEFDLIIRSLKGEGGYSKISASDEDVKGTLAHGKLDTGSCSITLNFVSQATKTEGFYTICERGFISKSKTSGSGAASAAAYVIQSEEG